MKDVSRHGFYKSPGYSVEYKLEATDPGQMETIWGIFSSPGERFFWPKFCQWPCCERGRLSWMMVKQGSGRNEAFSR